MLLKGVCHITNSWNTNISGSLWINRKFWWAQDCGSHEREAHVQRSLSLTISYLMERTWVSRQMEKIEPPLSPQSARTSGIQEHKCWEGIFLLVSPPLHTYRHSLPLLQDNFSAELKLLLRGRKILNKKKKPYQKQISIKQFKSPNDLPLQTSGAWQHLDGLLREQAERYVLIWKPSLKSGGSQLPKHKTFLFPPLPSACLLVCLSLFLRKDGYWWLGSGCKCSVRTHGQ